MSIVQRIAKNSAWQLASNFIQKIFSLVIVIVLAKKFGVDNFGLYSFAFSFVSIFVLTSDFGINNILAREIIRKSYPPRDFLVNALALKTVFSLVAFTAIIGFALFLKLGNFLILLVILASISMFLDSFAGVFRGLFFAYENFKYEFLVSFIYRTALLLSSLFVIFSGFGLLELLIVAVISSFINLLAAVYFSSKYTIKPSKRIRLDLLKQVFNTCKPFFLMVFLLSVFANIDIILLQFFWSQTQSGSYTAAARLVNALSLVSVMFMGVIHPVATKFYVLKNNSLSTLVQKSLYYLALFILPVPMLLFVFSKEIILFFYGTDFLSAVTPLIVLGFGAVFYFGADVFLTLLNSTKNENKSLFQLLIFTAVNLALNILLIPLYAENGAAFSSLLGRIISFTIGFYFVSKYIVKISIASIYLKPLIASIVMGIFAFLLSFLPSFLNFIISIFIYLAMIFILGALGKEDISYFKKIISRNKLEAPVESNNF